MLTYSNPDGVHTPFGSYHHIARVPAGAEWLALSGQVGADADGNVPADFRAQAELAYRNILTCLRAQHAAFDTGKDAEAFRWRAPVMLGAATLLFSATITSLGMLPAAFLLVMLAARADARTRWVSAILLGLFLSLVSWLIFVVALGMPLAAFAV